MTLQSPVGTDPIWCREFLFAPPKLLNTPTPFPHLKKILNYPPFFSPQTPLPRSLFPKHLLFRTTAFPLLSTALFSPISFPFSITLPHSPALALFRCPFSAFRHGPQYPLPFGTVRPNRTKWRVLFGSVWPNRGPLFRHGPPFDQIWSNKGPPLGQIGSNRCPPFGPVWSNGAARKGSTEGRRGWCLRARRALGESRCQGVMLGKEEMGGRGAVSERRKGAVLERRRARRKGMMPDRRRAWGTLLGRRWEGRCWGGKKMGTVPKGGEGDGRGVWKEKGRVV